MTVTDQYGWLDVVQQPIERGKSIIHTRPFEMTDYVGGGIE